MKTGALAAIIIITVVGIIVAVQKQDVQTGRILTCKQCSKVIQDSSQTLRVPWWKADDYHVSRELGYCETCGNESVSYTVNIQCQRCGRVYNNYSRSACRSQEPHDTNLTEGFCSDRCRNMGRIEHAVDRGSHAVGDVLGRVSRGIADGIRKHGR